MKKVEMYCLPSGSYPFEDWLLKHSLSSQARIYNYIKRVASGGSTKNVKPLGDGIIEIKIDYGPGYRVYFAEVGNVVILLLAGGNKSSQSRDIDRAKKYWRQFNV